MKIIFSIFLFAISVASWATTYTVTTTDNSGSGSLRNAMTLANASPGDHIIVFNIPTSDVNYDASKGIWKITPLSPLPIVTQDNLIIDGTSQTANQGDKNTLGPEIVIDATGQNANDYGFHLRNVENVTIKGFTIGGFVIGIQISGATSSNNKIFGNYIGCNYDGTDFLSNINGIEILQGGNNIIGGSQLEERNIVSGNSHAGIRMANSNSNIVQGNFVGIDRTGTVALKNADGISIEGTSKYNFIGGYTANERNYVSGNTAYGIPLFGTGCDYNIIVGNYVGTDISGTLSIPNTYGILCDDGASHNRIGGYEEGAGNLFSGNSGYGVFLYNPGTTNDSVIGNLIGTDKTGMNPLPNVNGIVVDGPTEGHFMDNNVISGNVQHGIALHLLATDNNIMVNNKIGVAKDGITALGNGLDGVRLGEGPRNNKVGRSGEGNIIAHNGGNGITVMTEQEKYNTFTENSIYSNGGIGIDLYPPGHTPNDVGDSDNGPNELMNFPEIQSIAINSQTGVATISGIVDNSNFETAEGIRVELFKAYMTQGKEFIGSTLTDNNGNWTFTCSCLNSNEKITATATDILGNTSEFYYLPAWLSLDENEVKKLNYSVFPNPARMTLSISGEQNIQRIEIHNLLGKKIVNQDINDIYSTLNLSELAKGSYWLFIVNDNQDVEKIQFIKE